MKVIEIHLAGANNEKEIEQIIESVCASQGLQVAMKGSLQKYPGCIHWHYQKVKSCGTLEITYWPSRNRCWLSLRDGRVKPWVVKVAKVLKAEIERQVSL